MFLEDYGPRDMFEIFKAYGLVHEVVIPSKRDRSERGYGFVRFHKVCDEYFLAVQLDNIFINSKNYTQTNQSFNALIGIMTRFVVWRNH